MIALGCLATGGRPMVRSAAFITVLALAFPAAAQTTTNCSSFGGTLTCDTAPNGFVALGNAIRQRRERKALAEEFVSDLRDGRCDAAQAIANQYGDANDRQMASACVSPERQAELPTINLLPNRPVPLSEAEAILYSPVEVLRVQVGDLPSQRALSVRLLLVGGRTPITPVASTISVL